MTPAAAANGTDMRQFGRLTKLKSVLQNRDASGDAPVVGEFEAELVRMQQLLQ